MRVRLSDLVEVPINDFVTIVGPIRVSAASYKEKEMEDSFCFGILLDKIFARRL